MAPWRDPGEALAAQVLAGASQTQVLNSAGLAPVRFVQQDDLPHGMAYERHVFETGAVPTRDGLQDFFRNRSADSMLCRPPRSKRQA